MSPVSSKASPLANLRRSFRRALASVGVVMIGAVAGLASIPAQSAVSIPQTPLAQGVAVPGNLVLTPSVEWPTIHTQANLGNFTWARTYVGYFDARKCYRYNFSTDEAERHFFPVRVTADGRCGGAGEWSGNYLAWAATQTIDPFRFALTGGYRVRDTAAETWLEKARHSPAFGQYPDRTITDDTMIREATPSTFSDFRIRIRGLGNRMYFSGTGDVNNPGANLVVYDPAVHDRLRDRNGERDLIYEVSIRVKVCDASVGVEANCVRYSTGWKPEGLLQEYSRQLTYSIFGYLNDSAEARDGAALRARQKFIGPLLHYPDQPSTSNPALEWDPTTGVLVRNPNPADATATGGGVADSGVINYLNKFGQMTNQNPKSLDPVSEMFYAATRYLKNQGNVPEYTNMAPANIYNQADGFPVITNWDDPIRYSCQTNVILGIGDVYTWNDKNLPGSPYNNNEPARPALVTADNTVNVQTRMQQIFNMEGFGALSNPFSGRNNSAFIAALAYDARTRDIRPDDPLRPNTRGRQSVSTYWVDVRENQTLEGRRSNPYWLATKYGGFNVPVGFDPDTNGATPLPQAWWNNTGDTVTDRNGIVIPRPDNFYVASEADRMVASLRTAFQNIVDEAAASGSALSANSTVLEAGSKIYQAQYTTGRWSGEIVAYDVNPATGALTQSWTASGAMPTWSSRNIFVNSGGSYRQFRFSNLSSGDASALGSSQVVDYLRGDRSNEAPNGLRLRQRTGVLGSIINSQPVFVGAPNPDRFRGATFTGASDYAAYASARAARRQVIYVGGNDGMLHGFDANTGVETYGFVPSAAIPNLRSYTEVGYTHRYFVDGELTIADAYVSGAWRSILVGTMGRGGRGVFALDVTDPNNVQFLWEKTAADIPALGNVIGKPIIAQVADGDWRVLFGNGPNGSGDRAQLVMIGLRTGSVTTVDTGAGSDNGMFGVNVWTSTPGGFADTVYAGDLRGNLWKITPLVGAPVATAFYNASSGSTVRPITSTPTVAVNPATNDTWVFFGTGSYLTIDDLTNRDQQRWFGLIDRGTSISGTSTLSEVSITTEGTVNGRLTRIIEENPSPGADGWYIDLGSPSGAATGERMVVPNVLRAGALIGVTRIADSTNVCNSASSGFLMAIDPFTGGRLRRPPFDINGDGNFNNNDGIAGVPASGFALESGGYNPLLVGDLVLTNLENTNISRDRINLPGVAPQRVSWREIIRN